MDVWLPFSPILCIRSEAQTIITQAQGSISDFQLHLHPPHLFPSLSKQACFFLRGELIEKQQFAFDKGAL